jgi:hypothetical protein
MVASGEMQSRQMEAAKTSQMLGMASQRLGAAQAARSAATQNLVGGVADLVGGVGGAMQAGDDGSGTQGIGEKILGGFGF